MTRRILLAAWLAFTVAIISACSSTPNPEDFRSADPVEYYFYVPEELTKQHVFVGIHGAGGSGRDCFHTWQPYAEREGFALLCPSLADAGGGWYQSEAEDKLWLSLQAVRLEHEFELMIFLAGFSAGGQFVQGVVFRYPQAISGVSVISSGNFYAPSTQARTVPFLVTVGEDDDPRRVDGAVSFSAQLTQAGIANDLYVIPRVGHAISTEAVQRTVDLYLRVSR
jgi:poly(3-hydroxybutyrate) depolymerase